MKAVVITQPGEPSVLQIAERPKPTYGENEVLIKVDAAGVNRPDVKQREGKYPPPAGVVQDIPGLEIAGTIVETGAAVSRWKIGDKVCALVAGGGYAEYCNAPELQCLPLPNGLSFIEAASLPETFFTVWSNVFDRGGFKDKETLLLDMTHEDQVVVLPGGSGGEPFRDLALPVRHESGHGPLGHLERTLGLWRLDVSGPAR